MYSLRAQLIVADWRRVLASEKSIGAFISQRTLFKRLGRLFNRGGSDAEAPDDDARATPETYDQWLLAYLQRMTDGYTPKPYDGAVTLLRSRLEPTGWFFREDAGWGEFAGAGVEVRFVDGNHFTMFRDPGAGQMAEHVAAALEITASTNPR
jgi:thioesterase domain-containing protein